MSEKLSHNITNKLKNSYIPRLIVSKCVGCGVCVEECPTEAIPESLIGLISSLAEINKENCISCGDCVDLCDQKAIILVKTEI